MENRSSKVIAMVGLVAGIVGLSLGFAAFSNTLTIKSSASVTPDQSTFDVNLYANTEGTTTSGVAVTNSSSLTVGTASISNDDTENPGTASIEGLSATFTQPGQSVSYTFYAKNVGNYNAFLKTITFNQASGSSTYIKCTPASGTDATLTATACNHIHLTVQVGNDTATSAPVAGYGPVTVNSHSLVKGAYEPIVVTISYDAETSETGIIRADGNFSVAFGDVDLYYASV